MAALIGATAASTCTVKAGAGAIKAGAGACAINGAKKNLLLQNWIYLVAKVAGIPGGRTLAH